MRSRRPFWEAALIVGLLAFAGMSYRPASARQAPAAADPHRWRRHRRRRHRARRARSRRLGDCRNHRAADEVQQDRRHRRSRALSHSRICPRPITTCGCADTGSSIRRKYLGARRGVEPDRRHGAQSARRGAVLSGNYWYSLVKVPAKSEFPGTGPTGNGINPNLKSQAEWLRLMKTDSCESCHQMGSKGTREIPALFNSSSDVRRQVGAPHSIGAGRRRHDGRHQQRLRRARALTMFADWTDRIAAGEVPPAPPRPQGIERNVVITQWDWADPKAYLHDEIATDRRNPTRERERPDLRRG